jgi:4-alpha-glucanotransferase
LLLTCSCVTDSGCQESAALFSAISGRPENVGKDWWNWTEALRDSDKEALAAVAQENKAQVDEYCALQFLFDFQWSKVTLPPPCKRTPTCDRAR